MTPKTFQLNFSPCQAELVFVVDDLGVESQSMDEQAALKGVTQEHPHCRATTPSKRSQTLITCSCLCGSVSIEIDEPLEHAPEACHCTQCRKQTGNFLVAVNVRRTAMRVTGEEHVTWYQSSETVQRGFCSACGSTLFWKPTIEGYQWTGVALGCIDTSMGLKIAKHTFVADKGSYYDITDDAPQRQAY